MVNIIGDENARGEKEANNQAEFAKETPKTT